MSGHLLEIKNLHTSFEVPAGEVRSVAGISFSVDKGKIVGIVGESGSGKSVTAASIMQILVSPGKIKEGSVVFNGEELVGMKEKNLRKIRGDKISMIFQDPMTALNPVYSIGHQMEEAMLLHKHDEIERLTEKESKQVVIDDTALAREKIKLKRSEKANDAVKIAEATKEISRLQATLAQDKISYSAAIKRAKAHLAYDKLLAKQAYSYERARERDKVINAFRGAISERLNERARYTNEKRVALRYEPVRKEEKLIASAAQTLLEDQNKASLEEEKFLLAISAASEQSVREKQQKALADSKAKWSAQIVKDEKALAQDKIEARKLVVEKRRELRHDHHQRNKVLRKTRFATIKTAIRGFQDAKHHYEAKFKVTRWLAAQRSVEMLKLVGVNEPEKRMKQYPFEFSGGMLQRVMIAMALLSNPDLLIADEPTTALDVTIQAQILELIKNIQKKLGMGVIIITHDLGVVAQICDSVNVMYAGRIVERGTVDDIFYNPQHEYTKGLLASMPGQDAKKGNKLHSIEGNPIDVFALPKGCSFAPRCEKCMELCLRLYPAERQISPTHYVSCFYSASEDYHQGKLTKDQLIAYFKQAFPIDTNNCAQPKKRRAKKVSEKKEEK